MSDTFSQLKLHPPLVQAVNEQGYTTPTPIQSAVIPLMLDGLDVIGQAQTGTGKTAAFALPILQQLTPKQGRRAIQALVLAPTRKTRGLGADPPRLGEADQHLPVCHMAISEGRQYDRRFFRPFGAFRAPCTRLPGDRAPG